MKRKFICEKCSIEFESEQECIDHEKSCPNKGEFKYVAECFYAVQTYYENPRHYLIFKKTVEVSNEFVAKFREIKNDTDYEMVNNIMYDDLVQDELPEDFMTTLIEHMNMCGDFNEGSVSKILDSETFTNYHGNMDYYPNDDLVAEIKFRTYYKHSDDIGMAFLSVYKLESCKIDKQDDVKISLRKWITDNVSR